MTTFDAIAFDADDTLWHSESLYAAAQEEYRRLLAPYAEAELIDRVLHQTEMQNLAVYGYGVKGFALSMIEAALELSQRQISVSAQNSAIAACSRAWSSCCSRILAGDTKLRGEKPRRSCSELKGIPA